MISHRFPSLTAALILPALGIAIVPPASLTAAQPTASTTLPALTAAPTVPTAAALADFPVLSGAVRAWFSSTRSPSTWQERANYVVPLMPDVAVDNYAQQLAAAGWSESSRSQTGDPTAQTLQFTADFLNGPTRAHLVCAQNQKQGTNVAVALTTQFPGGSSPSLALGRATLPTGATTSAMDRGTRDPADFPRLPGSVRTSFTATNQPGSIQEVATYAAPCAPVSADAFYAQSLAGGGWEEVARYGETNDVAKSDDISMTWHAAARAVAIALNGSTAGGVEIRVTLTSLPTAGSTAGRAGSAGAAPQITAPAATPSIAPAATNVGVVSTLAQQQIAQQIEQRQEQFAKAMQIFAQGFAQAVAQVVEAIIAVFVSGGGSVSAAEQQELNSALLQATAADAAKIVAVCTIICDMQSANLSAGSLYPCQLTGQQIDQVIASLPTSDSSATRLCNDLKPLLGRLRRK